MRFFDSTEPRPARSWFAIVDRDGQRQEATALSDDIGGVLEALTRWSAGEDVPFTVTTDHGVTTYERADVRRIELSWEA